MYFGLDIFLDAVFEMYVVWEYDVDKTTFRDIEVHVFKIPFWPIFAIFSKYHL